MKQMKRKIKCAYGIDSWNFFLNYIFKVKYNYIHLFYLFIKNKFVSVHFTKAALLAMSRVRSSDAQ